MLLTITYKGDHTQELGFLLHKNPSRPQSFDLSFGRAYVFYPKVTDEETTAALLLDLDPLDLAKGKAGSGDGGLFAYVNDRPYVASSFLSNAMAKTFSTAMGGRCEKKPELVKESLDLTATITMLPVRGNKEFLREVFEPLGYEVSYETFPVDEEYPEWGESAYVNLSLHGNLRLCELLNHLYVLIPVFDTGKHYYVSEDEINKLLKHGKEWLTSHPAKEKITRRYFSVAKSYAREALKQMTGQQPDPGTEAEEQGTVVTKENRIPLDRMRLEAVRDEVVAVGAKSVLDLGCGEGKLLYLLLDTPAEKITGADVSVEVLQRAKRRIDPDRLPERKKEKLSLFQGSILYADDRFCGFDAVCVVEVVEHIDPGRLAVAEKVLFEKAAPQTVILTTPNVEYNVNYGLAEGQLRHSDHRFEWTKEEFAAWCERICRKYGYHVTIRGIGEPNAEHGQPTQMGIFTKDSAAKDSGQGEIK